MDSTTDLKIRLINKIIDLSIYIGRYRQIAESTKGMSEMFTQELLAQLISELEIIKADLIILL